MPFAFFPTCDHRQSTMAAELLPSRFRSSGFLASLRWLMGWQAPGFKHRLKCGVVPLANLEPGDFVFFSAHALAGLVPSLSSFFLMLLQFYGLQLQHLSPNSITTVPMVLCNEGSEPAPAAHRQLLLRAPDAGPLPVHCFCLPRQVGALERRLGTGAGRCP
jgi:hypothetical protein